MTTQTNFAEQVADAFGKNPVLTKIEAGLRMTYATTLAGLENWQAIVDYGLEGLVADYKIPADLAPVMLRVANAKKGQTPTVTLQATATTEVTETTLPVAAQSPFGAYAPFVLRSARTPDAIAAMRLPSASESIAFMGRVAATSMMIELGVPELLAQQVVQWQSTNKRYSEADFGTKAMRYLALKKAGVEYLSPDLANNTVAMMHGNFGRLQAQYLGMLAQVSGNLMGAGLYGQNAQIAITSQTVNPMAIATVAGEMWQETANRFDPRSAAATMWGMLLKEYDDLMALMCTKSFQVACGLLAEDVKSNPLDSLPDAFRAANLPNVGPVLLIAENLREAFERAAIVGPSANTREALLYVGEPAAKIMAARLLLPPDATEAALTAGAQFQRDQSRPATPVVAQKRTVLRFALSLEFTRS